MREDAQKQCESISIEQIKETLKRLSPDKFDKMILTDDQSVERGDYIYVKLQYQKVERNIERIQFPLFESIANDFAELEGGKQKFGENFLMNSNEVLVTLNHNYNIDSEQYEGADTSQAFAFPLDMADNEVAEKQRIYFLPEFTYQEVCHNCNGNHYVPCTNEECGGRHEYECPTCHGHKTVDCVHCNMAGFIRCSRCDGRGRYRSGKGDIFICEECLGTGELRCSACDGRGEVNCPYCKRVGKIICKTCYGDKERYGMMDCETCKAIGKVAQIVYVTSMVSNNETVKIIIQGNSLGIPDSDIEKHINPNYQILPVYKKTNDTVNKNYDEYSQEYAANVEEELGLHKDSYPLVTKEAIYYQIVPCVKVSYKHMITNSIHYFTIIDFWDNPELIYHDDAEYLMGNTTNAIKSVDAFFAKIFKTKDYKTKQDKINEIVLLIHLIKVDGRVAEQEKVYLSEMIGNTSDFTNSDKQKLFKIMNGESLPELIKRDVMFSSKERGQEVLSNLNELAKADGELEPLEIKLIEKIRTLLIVYRV